MLLQLIKLCLLGRTSIFVKMLVNIAWLSLGAAPVTEYANTAVIISSQK